MALRSAARLASSMPCASPGWTTGRGVTVGTPPRATIFSARKSACLISSMAVFLNTSPKVSRSGPLITK